MTREIYLIVCGQYAIMRLSDNSAICIVIQIEAYCGMKKDLFVRMVPEVYLRNEHAPTYVELLQANSQIHGVFLIRRA